MVKVSISLTTEEEELLKADCIRNFPAVKPPSAQGWVEYVTRSKISSMQMEEQLARLNKLSADKIKEALDDYEKKVGK